jgi:hypothetical protein
MNSDLLSAAPGQTLDSLLETAGMPRKNSMMSASSSSVNGYGLHGGAEASAVGSYALANCRAELSVTPASNSGLCIWSDIRKHYEA